MHVLVACDTDWLADEVIAALGGPDTTFTVVSEGRAVAPQVAAVAADGGAYDVVVADLQIGSMGGIAVTMTLRLDASSGRLPPVPALLLLDRVADVQLARRSMADGWLVKPLDPLRLRRAVRAVAAGSRYTEGLADYEDGWVATTAGSLDIDADHGVEEVPTEPPPPAPAEQTAGSEPAPAG